MPFCLKSFFCLSLSYRSCQPFDLFACTVLWEFSQSLFFKPHYLSVGRKSLLFSEDYCFMIQKTFLNSFFLCCLNFCSLCSLSFKESLFFQKHFFSEDSFQFCENIRKSSIYKPKMKNLKNLLKKSFSTNPYSQLLLPWT